jgi:hypothetical protein
MLWLKLLLVQTAFAASIGPTPFPIFLKEGFSTILEFEEVPTQVVLGDANLFQVEKLNQSIVIKPLVAYATTNMFVYFKTKEARLFILAASVDAEPTYYKKFESPIPRVVEKTETKSAGSRAIRLGTRITSVAFDAKKDYLTVDLILSAGARARIAPNWDQVRLRFRNKTETPMKLWSERREAQRDSSIRARFVFAKPNVPADLKDVSLVVPVKGDPKAISLALKGPRS